MSRDAPHLSQRELEVMRLAARGQTDQAIANRLGIGVATVGTYWNRIRGKMGPHSRTELVAQYLRVEAHQAISALKEENSRLQTELGRQAESHEALAMFQNLLEAAPDAIVVVDSEGYLRYVNEQAAILFRLPKAKMIGAHLRLLVPKRFHGHHNLLRRQYMEHPERRAMGDHQGTTAVRGDGTEFPIAASLSVFSSGAETLVVCMIRSMESTEAEA